MPRPCGCLGGNENCTFCYGSGYVSGDNHAGVSRERREWSAGSVPSVKQWRAPVQTPKPVRRPELPRVRAAETPRVRYVGAGRSSPSGVGCPYCRIRFTTAGAVDIHVEREHVADANDASETAKAKPLVRIKGQIWERRRLPKESPRVVASSKPAVPQTPSAPATKRPIAPALPLVTQPAPMRVPIGRNLVQCPRCPSPVRADRLDRHLRHVHKAARNGAQLPAAPVRARKLSKRVSPGGPQRYKALAIGSGVGGPAGDDNDERSHELDNYWEERRLDGSRDYWQIREEGRFGSHPSFDSCDDESAP